ncbi:hypothetical protein ACFW9F_00570 [Streptomyces sp. NPDC059506]|uniref:hypothetical protein n=1 Tax=Streptomyces sp. NPDC059506 TaxID=3347751 RepID=UPI0036A8DCFB
MTVMSTALSAARRSAAFFTRVREAWAARRMPPLADGDRASGPQFPPADRAAPCGA